MDDTAKKDIRDLKKGQNTIMEILDSIVERQDHFEASVDKRFDRLEHQFEKVMTALDDIAGKLEDRKTEESAATVLLGAHAGQLTEHERRIRRLEQAAA